MRLYSVTATKQPRRPHYIEEWANRRNMNQADLARELNADKSVVSRWYAGGSPGKDYQDRLAALFGVDRDELFRHPEDNWLKRFFQKRKNLLNLLRTKNDEELSRIEQMIELSFPKKTGTDG